MFTSIEELCIRVACMLRVRAGLHANPRSYCGSCMFVHTTSAQMTSQNTIMAFDCGPPHCSRSKFASNHTSVSCTVRYTAATCCCQGALEHSSRLLHSHRNILHPRRPPSSAPALNSPIPIAPAVGCASVVVPSGAVEVLPVVLPGTLVQAAPAAGPAHGQINVCQHSTVISTSSLCSSPA